MEGASKAHFSSPCHFNVYFTHSPYVTVSHSHLPFGLSSVMHDMWCLLKREGAIGVGEVQAPVMFSAVGLSGSGLEESLLSLLPL